jgi:hypothetical protein
MPRRLLQQMIPGISSIFDIPSLSVTKDKRGNHALVCFRTEISGNTYLINCISFAFSSMNHAWTLKSFFVKVENTPRNANPVFGFEMSKRDTLFHFLKQRTIFHYNTLYLLDYYPSSTIQLIHAEIFKIATNDLLSNLD